MNDLYREYRENWTQCPYCHWVFRSTFSPEHKDCILKDIDEELRAEGR